MTCQACIPGKKWHIFRCYAEQNGSTASRCLLMILQVDTCPTDRAYPKRSRKKHEFHEVNPSQNWGLWWGMVQYGPSTCSNWVDELHCVLLRLASWGCFMALCLPHVPRKCQERSGGNTLWPGVSCCFSSPQRNARKRIWLYQRMWRQRSEFSSMWFRQGY